MMYDGNQDPMKTELRPRPEFFMAILPRYLCYK